MDVGPTGSGSRPSSAPCPGSPHGRGPHRIGVPPQLSRLPRVPTWTWAPQDRGPTPAQPPAQGPHMDVCPARSGSRPSSATCPGSPHGRVSCEIGSHPSSAACPGSPHGHRSCEIEVPPQLSRLPKVPRCPGLCLRVCFSLLLFATFAVRVCWGRHIPGPTDGTHTVDIHRTPGLEAQAWAGPGPPGASLLVCGRPSSPCVLTGSSLRACLCPDPSSYKDPGHTGSGPTPVAPCHLNHLCKDPPVQIRSRSEVLRVRTPTQESGGHNSALHTP